MKTNNKLNKDQRGITHHLMLVGLALVVAGAIGFAGLRIYKSKNDVTAKAASYRWTDLTNVFTGGKGGGVPKSKVTYYGCKTAITTTSNRVYVKAVKANDGNLPTINLGVFQIAADGTMAMGSSTSVNKVWSRGTSLQLNVITNTSPKEYVEVGYNDGFGGYSASFDPANVGNCTTR